MDFLLQLAQAGTESTWSSGDWVELIVAIVAGFGTLGAGLRVFGGWVIARMEAMRVDFNTQLGVKDGQIDGLSKKLSEKSDKHAETIERLQSFTIEKIEGSSERLAEVLERLAEEKAETNAVLRAIETRMQVRGTGSGTGTV